ncbi:galactose mutarotase-like isoform X2 [Paramacrobiotus metropolitanus]|uniref:galactose mutarotase-like isoform X2 n=1 Tax=Paramacrobiotus metropolitanus TaxID=2943436 RepID=UPI0024460539|nr:galactose mutarotase-like isoform X2 [Paramacrobiotus metropolitanus]
MASASPSTPFCDHFLEIKVPKSELDFWREQKVKDLCVKHGKPDKGKIHAWTDVEADTKDVNGYTISNYHRRVLFASPREFSSEFLADVDNCLKDDHKCRRAVLDKNVNPHGFTTDQAQKSQYFKKAEVLKARKDWQRYPNLTIYKQMSRVPEGKKSAEGSSSLPLSGMMSSHAVGKDERVVNNAEFKEIQRKKQAKDPEPLVPLTPPWTKTTFGQLNFSQNVHQYTIRNSRGSQMSLIDYGARIVGLKVLAANGMFVDVVRGFRALQDYVNDDQHVGTLMRRVAGKIEPMKVYDAVQGLIGFDKVIWHAELIEDSYGVGVRFRHGSLSSTEGCVVEYRLNNEDEVIINIRYLAEEMTIASTSNHAYLNLGGQDEQNIYDHVVSIAAQSYLLINDSPIPTGIIVPVEKFCDFREGRRLGDVIPATPDKGYDNYFCLPDVPRTAPTHAAKIFHPKTGISMEILTTQPGVLMYTGNYLSGKCGEILDRHSALCFETQNYPNAINTLGFHSPVVHADQTPLHTTIWKFTKQKD